MHATNVETISTACDFFYIFCFGFLNFFLFHFIIIFFFFILISAGKRRKTKDKKRTTWLCNQLTVKHECEQWINVLKNVTGAVEMERWKVCAEILYSYLCFIYLDISSNRQKLSARKKNSQTRNTKQREKKSKLSNKYDENDTQTNFLNAISLDVSVKRTGSWAAGHELNTQSERTELFVQSMLTHLKQFDENYFIVSTIFHA